MNRNDEKKEEKLQEKALLENGMVGNAYDQSWRPKVVVDAIAMLPPRPGYVRKGVIINYKHLPQNLENHEKAGYQVVYSLQSMTDERKFSPNVNQATNTIPAPILQRTKDGYEMVVMEIEESKLQAYNETKEKIDHQKYLRSVASEEKKGNTIKRHGGEIKF